MEKMQFSGEKMMNEILELLEKDCRMSPAQIAAMTGKSETEVRAAIEAYEKDGTIVGYKALIDWDKTGRELVSAVIELKVRPSRDRGFDAIAETVYKYPEVRSLQLMSSAGYDLMLIVEGKTMKEVAYFVSNKVSTLDGVISTATHFVLKKYKSEGAVYGKKAVDEREQMYDGIQ